MQEGLDNWISAPSLKLYLAAIKVDMLMRKDQDSRSLCVYVDSEEAFGRLERALQSHYQIAIDTESNNCHSYSPRVCLVQFSVMAKGSSSEDGEGIVYLLDPFSIDLSRLSPFFDDPEKLFILHSAANDLGQLYQEFRISIANVFDTQVAARLIGLERTALAGLLEREFGVSQSKSVQTSDWGKRPLNESQIRYASQDVAFLIPLYHRLEYSLREIGRLQEGLAVMEELARRDYSRFGSYSKTFWDHPATKRVPIQLMNVYQSLWEWRENEARSADLPRNNVIGDKPLLLMTREQPDSLAKLRKCSGLSNLQVKRHGTKLLRAIEKGQSLGQPVKPARSAAETDEGNHKERQRDLMQRLRKWRQEISQHRGVDCDFVLSKYILQVISEDAPASLDDLANSNLLVDWKFQHYGEDVVQIVRNAVLPKH